MYVLLYTDNRQVRGQRKATRRGLSTLLAFAKRQPIWALYKATHKGRAFHNATDPAFLICHNDPYWHNALKEH